jgi:hypothetical protein
MVEAVEVAELVVLVEQVRLLVLLEPQAHLVIVAIVVIMVL